MAADCGDGILSLLRPRSPSGPYSARPALRAPARGAVRPRAASPSRLREACSAPRPAGDVDRASARARFLSLFLCPAPRPEGMQRCGLPRAHRKGGPGGVGTGTALGTPVGTPKLLRRRGFPACFHCSRLGRARVMYMHARAHRFLPISMGTWEQVSFIFVDEKLSSFPRSFPSRQRVGTWERRSLASSSPDRLCAPANKIAGGYADLRCVGGGARRKFRAPIARLGLAQGGSAWARRPAPIGLELGRDQAQLRGSGNGGFPPFFGGALGHVGRADVGRLGQGLGTASFSGARQKLGRLTGLRPGALAAGAVQLLDLVPAAAIAASSAPEGGGPPQPRADLPSMPALHAGRIWIETAIRGALARASSRDCPLGSRDGRKLVGWRRGPGGICPAQTPAEGRRPRHSRFGKRAGVNSLPAGSQAPNEGGFRTLGPGFSGVNSGSGVAL